MVMKMTAPTMRQLVPLEAPPGQLPLAQRFERDLVVGAGQIGRGLAQPRVRVVLLAPGSLVRSSAAIST